MRRDDTNLNQQKTQRKKLSQRFTNNPHVGTFGSYKQHDEEFTMIPSPTSKSLSERKSLLPMETAKENPYLGYLRHAPSIDNDNNVKPSSQHSSQGSNSTTCFGSCGGDNTTTTTNTTCCSSHGCCGGISSSSHSHTNSNKGLFELLRETPAHAAVTRIGMLGEVWRKRHLSQRLLKELPLISFTTARPTGILGILMCESVHHGQTTCAICKCEFEEDESLRLLPCGHVFHKGCADKWLLGSDGYPFIQTNTCPLCKINVAEEINKSCRNGITRSQYAAVGQYVWNNCSSRRRKTNKDEPIKVFATSPAIHRVHYGPQMDNNAVQIIVNLLKYHQRTNFKNNMTNKRIQLYCRYTTPYDQIPDAICA